MITSTEKFNIYELSKELAIKYAHEINTALDQIPLVDKHTTEDLLAETKKGRVLHAKWDHSIIALDKNNQFAGVVIGYEREKESNDQYPSNSIYLSSFAVARQFQKQGLGKILVKVWLEFNKKTGFLRLDGDLQFSVQTNSADWNSHVQKLYESFGFQITNKKTYDNRIDNIYSLSK